MVAVRTVRILCTGILEGRKIWPKEWVIKIVSNPSEKNDINFVILLFPIARKYKISFILTIYIKPYFLVSLYLIKL